MVLVSALLRPHKLRKLVFIASILTVERRHEIKSGQQQAVYDGSVSVIGLARFWLQTIELQLKEVIKLIIPSPSPSPE